MSEDARQYAPSVARNRAPIWAVLQRCLPQRGLVLEIASGSGEHTIHFAQCCAEAGADGSARDIVFQPTDRDPLARASINAWIEASGLPNIRPALALDAADETWPVDAADVVLCFNMIHISPWASTLGLMQGAARVLPAGGMLVLYGPYKREGRHTAPSNEAFDRDFLKARNPEWGVRDLEAVVAVAAEAGFAAPVIEEMPANNLCLLFRRLA